MSDISVRTERDTDGKTHQRDRDLSDDQNNTIERQHRLNTTPDLRGPILCEGLLMRFVR